MKSFTDFNIQIPLTGGAERFTTCPQCAPTRKKKNAKCLSVNTEKEVWLCHHCGWKGSLKQGEQGRPQVDRWRAPAYTRPAYSPPPTPSVQLLTFFEERGISSVTLDRYKISLGVEWMPISEDRVPVIQFPYYRGDMVVNIKSRTLVGKEFRQVSDAEKILYGLNDIEQQTEAIFVEGECDKLALAEAGIFHAVSVPDGAPAENAKPSAKKFEYLENCERYLEPLTKIVLAVDSDGPGKALERELLRRLGPERCYTVTWPDGIKDANQLLIERGAEALREAIAQAIPTPIEHVLAVHDLAGSLMRYYYEGRQRGLSTGWPGLDELFTVSPGQFTSITGIPSHGKSELMDALMINMIDLHGAIFAVCSPENRPIEHHLAKLAEKIIGVPFLPGPSERMTTEEVNHALNWLEPHLYVIDSPESLSVDELLEKARALVLQKGITHLILDPWNEFDHSRPPHQTETDYISQSISKMKGFGRRSGVHIFCVAHPVKLIRDKNGNYPVPTPYDISGCHSADTEVLTQRGWLPHAQVELSDQVCCFDLEAQQLFYAHPEHIHVYPYSGNMMNFKSPSFDALVTPNHRMVVKPSWRSSPSLASRLKWNGKGRPLVYPRREQWSFRDAKSIVGQELLMPWATPLRETEEWTEISDEELQIVGWYVTEGHASMGSISWCQAQGTLADKMQAVLARTLFDYTIRCTHYKIEEKPMWSARLRVRNDAHTHLFAKMVLRECGERGAQFKQLPQWTWMLSARQKTILMCALMEGDGSPGRGDSMRFATTSCRLANDVQRLAIEIGRMAVISSAPGVKPHHFTRYQVSIGRSNRRTITLRSSRHLSEEPYDGAVYCLTVPGGAYLTRRNGKPGIYGNSAHWRNKPDNCMTVWRNTQNDLHYSEIHMTKVRWKQNGRIGRMALQWNPINGTYSETQLREDQHG